jgi:hypothetical protein
MKKWVGRNRIELLLFVLFVTALGWFGWLGYGLTPPNLVAQLLGRPTPAPLVFNREKALQHATFQCDLGPRPVNSEGLHKLQTYIVEQLDAIKWTVERQPFTYQETPGVNLIARPAADPHPDAPIALIGAHYDTRRLADNDPDPARRTQPVLGANDGASGVAVLLELARTLVLYQSRYRVRLAFFDAEDNGQIDGWNFIAGSTYMAQALTPETRPAVMILADMVGDADQQLYFDRNSDVDLRTQLWQIADRLGYGQFFIPEVKWSMLDDHTPFAQLGIPAVDIIDFDYPPWHTTADTCDKLGVLSLERVGRTIETYVEQGE